MKDLRVTLLSPKVHFTPKTYWLVQNRFYSAPGEGFIPESKQKYVPKSGKYPKGFLVGSAHVGVKPSNTNRHDLAVIASVLPASGAAVFTKNKFQAAPVTVTKEILKSKNGKNLRGLVINSGCANAVTGKGGIRDAYSMSKEVDRCFQEERDDHELTPSTLVMSTGVIGQSLPINKICQKIPEVCSVGGSSHGHWLSVARAICTTDTFPKLMSRSFILPTCPQTTYSLAGMAKGAGMIHPNMATLLGVICTDAPISPRALQSLLTTAVEKSFNSISIDGDMFSSQSEDFRAFQSVLTSFATDLAKLVVRDGEGATKFITVRVTGSPSYSAAKQIASTISRSPLVKTALYGRDANWGRILCAAGYALVDSPLGQSDVVIPNQTSVSFVPADGGKELKLLIDGEPEDLDEERAAQILENEDVEILVRLRSNGDKGEEAIYWTCDFSHEYVTINGDYRT